MTKKELIATLASVDDNAEILFGNEKMGMVGSFATRIYYCEDGNGRSVLITNEHVDSNTPANCELMKQK